MLCSGKLRKPERSAGRKQNEQCKGLIKMDIDVYVERFFFFMIRVDKVEGERLKRDFFPAFDKDRALLYMRERFTYYWYENEDDEGITYIFSSDHAAFQWNTKELFKEAKILPERPDLSGFIAICGGSKKRRITEPL